MSDIDLFIIFRDSFLPDEEMQARQFFQYCKLISPLDLELPISDEKSLFTVNSVALKMNSLLIYGEDMREKIVLPFIDEYIRQVIFFPKRYFGSVLRNMETLVYPLNYPNPDGEFYGYDKKIDSRDEFDIRSTKWLVVNVCWIATAIIAMKARRYVAAKSHCIRLYRESINDEWTNYLDFIYLKCKILWGYQIPKKKNDRRLLRDICKRTLAFENHFLNIYKDYLLSELSSNVEDNKLLALRKMAEIVYPDDEIIRILQEVIINGSEELCQAAKKASLRIQAVSLHNH
ncbi:MAG: hypothetical protein AMJ43_09510 [Coxiella sp. DG_40]|nr:MAG: hypothetical protein AMJ43_09510 [Coxiella sp. DG_40]